MLKVSMFSFQSKSQVRILCGKTFFFYVNGFLCSCSGLPVVSVGSSDWCTVRYLGQKVLPPYDGLLHLRPHPLHEDQPMVKQTAFTFQNIKYIVLSLFCPTTV